MCFDNVVNAGKERGLDPAEILAEVLSSELGVTIRASRLENALCNRWGSIAHLAHMIHDRHQRRIQNTHGVQHAMAGGEGL